MAFNNYLIHHTSLNAPSRFVRLLFAEKGIDFNLKQEKFWEKSNDFRVLNHSGTVPVLELQDIVICGAIPISEYLEEEILGKKLYGETYAQKAENRRLVEWFMYNFETEVNRYIVEERVFKYLQGKPSNSQKIQIGRVNMRNHLRYLDTMLIEFLPDGSKNYLHENRENVLNCSALGVGDFAAASCISVLDYLGEINWKDYKNIADWYCRVKSRPSFKSILEDYISFMKPSKHYKNLDFQND